MISAPSESIAVDPRTFWQRLVSVRGEMTWVVIGQAAAALGGIVGVRLLTHWLPPEAYGQLALGLTLATLIQQGMLSPFTGAGLRFYAAAQSNSELGVFHIALKSCLTRATLLVSAILILGICGLYFAQQLEWIPILFWSILFAVFCGLSTTLDGMQNAARQRVVVAWHDGLGVWLRFLMGTAAVIILGARATNALIGFTLASLIVFGSQYWFFSRDRVPLKLEALDSDKIEKWRRAIVAYGWPFATFGIFVWVQGASERWALNFFADTAQVGEYAVLFQLGFYPITMLSGMFMQLLTPMVFQVAGNGENADQVRQCRRLATKLSLATLVATGGLAIIAKSVASQLFALIVPPSYWTCAYLLPYVVLTSGIFAAGQISCLGLMSGTSTKELILPKVGTAIIAVVLNIAGAYIGGLRGVILASLLFSLLHLAWVFHLSLDLGDFCRNS